MHKRLLFLALALSGCSRSDASPLTQTDWTNGLQPCSANRLSFKDDKIAYYPKGQPVLLAYEIDSILVDGNDPNLAVVTANPGPVLRDTWKRHGLKLAAEFRFVFSFAIARNRLKLTEVRTSPATDGAFDPVQMAHTFDLVRCDR